MRLLFYAKGFPPCETGGTVEVAFHLVQELLRDDRIHVSLVVQTDSTEDEIRGVLGRGERVERLDVLRLPYYPTPREVPALRRTVRALLHADIVHFNEFPFRHLPLILLAKVRGVPVVYSLHGLMSREIRTFWGPAYPLTLQGGDGSMRVRLPRPIAAALLTVYRSIAGLWTAVVAPSKALVHEAVASEHFRRDRVRVIPHGVDASERMTTPPEPHGGPPRILFVGKLEAIKGPDLLLAALERLLAGGILVDASIVGAGSLEEGLQEWARRLRPQRITFHGMRRGPDLESLYARSDIVVVPSRSETLSLVVLEAMAAGRPIVATNVGGIPEVVREPRNALLVPPNPASLAAGLRLLIEEPGLREAMRQANLEDARHRRWSDAVSRYVQLYDHLVSDTGDPPTGAPSGREDLVAAADGQE